MNYSAPGLDRMLKMKLGDLFVFCKGEDSPDFLEGQLALFCGYSLISSGKILVPKGSAVSVAGAAIIFPSLIKTFPEEPVYAGAKFEISLFMLGESFFQHKIGIPVSLTQVLNRIDEGGDKFL